MPPRDFAFWAKSLRGQLFKKNSHYKTYFDQYCYDLFSRDSSDLIITQIMDMSWCNYLEVFLCSFQCKHRAFSTGFPPNDGASAFFWCLIGFDQIDEEASIEGVNNTLPDAMLTGTDFLHSRVPAVPCPSFELGRRAPFQTFNELFGLLQDQEQVGWLAVELKFGPVLNYCLFSPKKNQEAWPRKNKIKPCKG